MLFFKKKYIIEVSNIYNKISDLSREKFLYTDINIEDSFNSRTNLIFLYFSFLLIRIKKMKELEKKFSQQMFDYMFEQIEANMRELGIGDISVNKKMKTFIRHFYNILLKCEKYEKMSPNKKINLFESIFSNNGQFKSTKLDKLVIYFDNFFIFTSNLSFNHIIKGNINFIY